MPPLPLPSRLTLVPRPFQLPSLLPLLIPLHLIQLLSRRTVVLIVSASTAFRA